MNTRRTLVSLMVLFVFLLSFSPPSSSQSLEEVSQKLEEAGGGFLDKTFEKLEQLRKVYGYYKKGKKFISLFPAPSTPTFPFIYHLVTLQVGPQKVYLALDITGIFTQIYLDGSFALSLSRRSLTLNEFDINNVCKILASEQTCPAQCSCPIINRNVLSFLALDTFYLGGDGYNYRAACKFLFSTKLGNNLNAKGDFLGVASFSNNPYSLVNQLGIKIFSYRLSSTDPQSNLRILTDHNEFPVIYQYQSTMLKTFDHQYRVALSAISVVRGDGSTNRINIRIPFINGYDMATLESLYPYISLESAAYNQLLAEIMKHGNLVPPQKSSTTILELCYRNPVIWPRNLILHFETADMVLAKKNFVVRDPITGFECLAVQRSEQGIFTRIGRVAQLDREMIFDLAKSTLYFTNA